MGEWWWIEWNGDWTSLAWEVSYACYHLCRSDAPLLLATPVTQVLGQAHQQDSIASQSSAVIPPPIHSVALLEPVSWVSWVPRLQSAGTTDLPLAPGVVGRWDATDSLPVPAAAPISKDATTAILVVVVLAALVIGVILIVNSIEAEFGKLGM